MDRPASVVLVSRGERASGQAHDLLQPHKSRASPTLLRAVATSCGRTWRTGRALSVVADGEREGTVRPMVPRRDDAAHVSAARATAVSDGVGQGLARDGEREVGLPGVIGSGPRLGQGAGDPQLSYVLEHGFHLVPTVGRLGGITRGSRHRRPRRFGIPRARERADGPARVLEARSREAVDRGEGPVELVVARGPGKAL